MLPHSDPYPALDEFLGRELRRLRIPGAALVIVEGDRVTHTRGFGYAQPAGPPPTPQTPFFIGSVTKSFTATAVMQLAERGMVDLDAPVQRYLPWFRVADPAASAAITVRHLLNQTSGFSMVVGSAVLGDQDDSPGACERQVRALATYRHTRPPGAAFDYSNTNFQILGLIVEVVSGKSYADYVHTSIFEPLGMAHSYTAKTEARRANLATGHRFWFWHPVPEPGLRVGTGPLAGGLLISCSEDLARYLIANLNSGRCEGAQVLSATGIAEMQRGAVEVEEMGVRIGQYGMGWFLSDLGPPGAGMTRVVWHSGLVPDFAAFVAMIPGQRRGFALLLNAGHFWMEPIINQMGLALAAILAGSPPEPDPMAWLRFVPPVMQALPLVTLLQTAGIALTVRSRLASRSDPILQPDRAPGSARGISLLPGLALAALPVLLRASPLARFIKLYAPDVWLLAHLTGFLAALWSVLRAGLVPLTTLRKKRRINE